ncbi:hypothetical protein CERZMDRAFT_102168 [Cercospora zeae-maydis SCOH1-5]|uniref:C2H2-type domain-containing protein n=1 Tax=Cercospora zeae-maydis SCOH1-5 TaxID=717836 RepID=A0A6A6F567_9PEZI|nr:hypothetical protein CERZMDRAFT_102168 [Cercospora zeae-maydis SCOH1-5]
MLAYSQYNGMAASPIAGGYHRPAPQTIPRSQPITHPHNMTDYFQQFTMETSHLQPHHDFMQMQRLSTSAPSTVQPDRGIAPGSMDRPRMQSYAGPSNLGVTGQYFGRPMQPPSMPAVGFANAYHALHGINAMPQHLALPQQYHELEQLFPELNEPMHRPPQQQTPLVSQYETAPTMPATSVPQVLSNENLDHHNLHVESQPCGQMQGWLGRANAAGGQNMLRLDTNRLVPPPVSDAHLSPTSASSAASSAGRSPRRSREAMVLGEISCSQCDAAFSTQGDLTHHLRSHAPYQSRNHVCPTCKKRFQYKKDLARHLPRHDPNRQRFYCRHTGCKYHTKGFGRQDHLDRHLATQHRSES